MAVDPTSRFAELVGAPPREVTQHLDEAALLIAAHAHPALDVDDYRTRLDDLAQRAQEPRLADVAHVLFAEEGFQGNQDDYYDPRNSYLDDVLDRRLGIPITLGVVLIEVARRAGISLVGVGMPGHFLVRLEDEPSIFLDPFDGGVLLSPTDCEHRFHAVQGDAAAFDPEYLEPVGALTIVARMLANLRQIHTVRHDSLALEWVLRLRSLLPGASLEERSERAGALAALARFDEAATILEDLAEEAPEQRADALVAKARRLRARLN
jgi:regulator of sirC expression with transglutaminase-like and TPR domain